VDTNAGMRTLAAFVISAALAAAAPSGSASGPVRAEIEVLLARLAASGCEFNRNGTWYNGADARNHLQRKLGYLENRGTLRSTEQFIELAATSSSSSGQAYQVKCGGAAAQTSAQWLTKELAVIRLPARQAASTPR
jgi:Family of unknown function (DUF5329)